MSALRPSEGADVCRVHQVTVTRVSSAAEHMYQFRPVSTSAVHSRQCTSALVVGSTGVIGYVCVIQLLISQVTQLMHEKTLVPN